MSVRITVVDDKGTIDRLNKILANVPGGVQQAITSASKRAGDKGKSKAGTFIAERYTLSKGSFMAKTKTRLTIQDGFTLDFTGGVISLRRFKVKDNFPNGVFAFVKKSEGGGTLPHAFTGPNGHIFERTGLSRLPIEKKTGPSGPSMMKNEEIIEDMSKLIEEEFEKRMEHEINRILAGI